MHDALTEIRHEHSQMAELLAILEREVLKLKEGAHADFFLIDELIGFFETFPESVHHHKEDVIYRALAPKLVAAAYALPDLEAEHAELEKLANDAADCIRAVENDEEVSRETLYQTVKAYIDRTRQHMQAEESRFLPAADKHLTDGEWSEIEAGIDAVKSDAHTQGAIDQLKVFHDQLLGMV